MIPITTFSGLDVAVFGLGASGNATAYALMEGGARVAAWDDSEAGRKSAAAAGVPLVDLFREDWSRFAALILAPGVPLTHPEPHWTVGKARAAGVDVIGDIELFCRERAAICPAAPFIAITGTNGKSTTTALIAHILKEAGHDVQLGGNIGRAILTLEPLQPERFYVVECSSFQIDLAPSIRPSVGVLLNVTPDHLDRHGTMENYARVKERLVAGADAAAVVVDDDCTRAIAGKYLAAGKPLLTASTLDSADITYEGSVVSYHGEPVADLAGVPSLRGRHNGENACAAYGALRLAGLFDNEIAPFLSTYPGLPHRMEQIGRLGDTLFINDSKATNAESTAKALAAWPEGIHLILGGKAKDGGIEGLRCFFPRLTKAYLIGAATDEFASTLGTAVPFEACGTLDVAVARATQDALTSGAAESVVLLSPACASYDQFKNFEERGDYFRRLVAAELARRGTP
ncbi:MAG: UDP-N-acetylmuramoyl-L-alanine--D-glutamate ligase [Hyphomicrobium sp.]|jgi:UDP-N-acetylmuramoylalanine--D-glutamate ligase|nr:UDP-N-acetylmuramoyl-L-alanine--D-glutamate ligase [Hyphomicrobium sp.]